MDRADPSATGEAGSAPETVRNGTEAARPGEPTAPAPGDSGIRLPQPPALPVELASPTARWALLAVLVILSITGLRIARSVVLPLVVAMLLAALLSPLVRRLEALRIPAPLGAGLVLASLLGLCGWAGYALSGPAAEWLAKAPRSLHRLEHKIREVQKPVNEAAEQVEKITSVGDRSSQSTQVAVEKEDPLDLFLSGTGRFIAATLVTLVLVFFLLATGKTFLAAALEALPDRSSRRTAMSVLRRIGSDVSVYLLTITVINSALALAVGTALHFAGMPNPYLWGALAGLLNFVPYLGAMTTATILGVVALLSFDNPWQALGIVALFGAITATEGMLITPAVLGHRMRLHPIVVFVSLMFWGWLWGIPGALLAVPLTASIKIVGDEVRSLRPLAQVLGR